MPPNNLGAVLEFLSSALVTTKARFQLTITLCLGELVSVVSQSFTGEQFVKCVELWAVTHQAEDLGWVCGHVEPAQQAAAG